MARVLVLDDNKAICLAMVRMLGGRHEVRYAHDGRCLDQRIARHEPDLVLVDLNMPEVNGIEVIIRLSELRPELPVIAFTGGGLFPAELNLDAAKILGAVATLEKPLHNRKLQRLVDDLLCRAKGGGEVQRDPKTTY
jgi:CheY-like chemotaxis protein